MSHDTVGRENIDIEEFERRMRGPAPRPPGDPLAELARLVTTPETKPEALDALFARSEPADRAGGAVGIDLGRLRGGHHEPSDLDAAHAMSSATGHEHGFTPEAALDDGAAWATSSEERVMPPAARSRRPLYLTAAVIGVGLLGIGGTFAMKGRHAGSGDLVEVKAASGPVKVQAQTSDTTTADPGSSVLDRGIATQPVTRIVDRQEKPVDLKDVAARTARPGASQMANLAAAAASGDTGQAFPEPRRVKTVSVRPDGTIVGGAAPAAASAAPSGATPSVSMPLSGSSGAKTSTPKTATRAATTPKPPVEAADATPKAAAKPAAKPVAAKPVAAKPAPAKVASAQVDDEASDTAAAAAATPTARASGGDGGGFVVQLAAPGNEADAKATASRLSKKFSGELGGSRIGVQKAGDKEVYRVRTASMSRESAVAACEKIKASGGACFVAKN